MVISSTRDTGRNNQIPYPKVRFGVANRKVTTTINQTQRSLQVVRKSYVGTSPNSLIIGKVTSVSEKPKYDIDRAYRNKAENNNDNKEQSKKF